MSNSYMEQFFAELSNLRGFFWTLSITFKNSIMKPPWVTTKIFSYYFPSGFKWVLIICSKNLVALLLTSIQFYPPSHLYFLRFTDYFFAFCYHVIIGFPSSTPPHLSRTIGVKVVAIFFSYGYLEQAP